MGNILNKNVFYCIWNTTEKVNKCLGISEQTKKTDKTIPDVNFRNLPTSINSMNNEFSDYDIVEKNEIYP